MNDPGQVISRIAACEYNDPVMVYGEISNFSSNSTIVLNFAHADTIHPDQPDSVGLIVDISQAPQQKSLMIEMMSASDILIHEDLTMNVPKLENEITGQTGENLFTGHDFIVIMGDNLKDSFGNYPNPFGNSNRKTTTITYNLKENTSVDIKIYSLIGELVWSCCFNENDPQGQKSMHDGDVVWDGRNNLGKKVLNGVYIIYLKTGSGETAITKAAVVK